MGITGQAHHCLAARQQFCQLGVSFMKFDVVAGNFFQQRDGSFVTFKFVLGKSDQQLDVPRLSDHFVLPSRIGQIIELLRLVLRLYQGCVPSDLQ